MQEINNDRITAAINFLISNHMVRQQLQDVAGHMRMDHNHHLFHELVGVTPDQFAMYLSVEHAKKVLNETHSALFDGIGNAGLPISSGQHNLSISIESMTPGEYKNGGESLTIDYSFADTPFGNIITGATYKGICHMAFADRGETEALERLKSFFPNAAYRQTTDSNQLNALSVFTGNWNDTDKIKLHLRGTEFQIKVWQALLHVPSGGLTTYSDLAVKAGSVGAQRAVGAAMGANPVVFLIPCHRVIKASGVIGNYHYGEVRKNAMIGWEAAQHK